MKANTCKRHSLTRQEIKSVDVEECHHLKKKEGTVIVAECLWNKKLNKCEILSLWKFSCNPFVLESISRENFSTKENNLFIIWSMLKLTLMHK